MPKQKILLVEDEKDIAEAIEYALELDGFEVITAYDGEEALTKLSKAKPDLVVLDILLPKIDGWEVLSAIRREPTTENLPVIILTAKVLEASKLCGFHLGADDYVTKPFSVDELLARAKAVLKRSQKGLEKRKLKENLLKIPIGTKGEEEISLNQEDILYIKGLENYTYVYTSEDRFLTKLKMYQFEEKLADFFMRIHRSYIVNLHRIQAILPRDKYSYCVQLSDEEETILPISRLKIKELRDYLAI